MIRHFPESPFYKTEQSGAVLGKWGGEAWSFTHSSPDPL